ncbi:P-loop NTPase fold protein [Clostridium botulinum]|uniref:P-loop NTPase fold protein n=1 Tax=Clostridium botulinum TaxID=1491 RepID=UPI001C9B345C|nr:P-loop NTPase fold protein [Clostridium botulinum]MBY6811662.1 AAA family ATPase [Clostridium botulinum]MBY6825349.1 AAA family ATPase [Clostridium botulinum]MBY6835471.1 AAA family ATPase [Clostridium botulinum]MBY6973870.1 AAA family ATPase [Clostridium botulinum]MCS6105317.1 hypothetical protein [Clostridium botulinum]
MFGDVITDFSSAIGSIITGYAKINELILEKIFEIILIWTSIFVILTIICVILYFLKLKKEKVRECIIFKNGISHNINISITIYFLARIYVSLSSDNTIINKFSHILYYVPLVLAMIFISYAINKIIYYKKFYNINNIYYDLLLYMNYFLLFISSCVNKKHTVISILAIFIVLEMKFISEMKIFSIFKKKENTEENNNIEDNEDIIEENDNTNTKDNTVKCKLYNTRERQLLPFYETVIKTYDENYAIALTGEWGSGKSIFLKEFVDRYKSENYYIYIKPMISDTTDGLINQFSTQLIDIIQLEGIYIGRNNNIRKYFNEILKLINFNTKVSLNSFLNFEDDTASYIKLKEKIQDDIDLLLQKNKKKLIVVIDDFDRIDEDKQEVILHFIQEIIDFKGCTTIFALDYLSIKKNKKLTKTYMEKFVSKSFSISKVTFTEIIEYQMDEMFKEIEITSEEFGRIFDNIKANIYYYHYLIEKRIEKRIKELEEEKEKNKDDKRLKKYFYKFKKYCLNKENDINNSRRVIHFLDSIKDTILIISKLYAGYSNSSELLKSIKTSEIIYVFNYIKVFEKDIYDDFIKSGGINFYRNSFIRDEGGQGVDDKEILIDYFNILIKDVVSEENDKELFKSESRELKRINERRFINDVFIDYNFTKNNIKIIIESEQYFNILKNNFEKSEEDIDFGIIENHFEKIKIIKRAIIDYSQSEDELIYYTKVLVKYIKKCYKDKLIKTTKEMIELVFYRTDIYRESRVIKYYLELFFELINNRSIIVDDDVKKYILTNIHDMEFNNVICFRDNIINYISILKLERGNYNYDYILDKLRDFYDIEGFKGKLINLIEEDIDLNINKDKISFDNLFHVLRENIDRKKYKDINFDIMDEKMQEFSSNCNLILELKNIDIEKKERNFYEGLALYWDIKTKEQIIELLNKLMLEEKIDNNMTMCFKKVISQINSNKDFVDKQIVEYCELILNKIIEQKDEGDDSIIYMQISIKNILLLCNQSIKENHPLKPTPNPINPD